MRPVSTAILSAALLFLCGCSVIENAHRQKMTMMSDLLSGNNDAVMAELDGRLDEPGWFSSSVVGTGDELMWRLEAGSMKFHLGKFKQCLEEFRIAERLIREYDDRAKVSARDVSAEAGAAVTNLNALPYRGFCRDRIMIAVYKSLAYLGAGREEAFRAQLRRLRAEQKKVQEDYREFFDQEKAELAKERRQNPKEARKATADASHITENAEFSEGLKQVAAHRGYGNFLNPAAIFLSGLGSVRDGRFDNARIDFRRLCMAMPDQPVFRRYLKSVLLKAGRELPEDLRDVKEFEFPLDRNCVYVLFANGRGAAFKQISISVPIMAAWPMCEFYDAPFAGFAAAAGGSRYEGTLLADMDGILAQEYQERLPGMIARIVISTLIKEAAYYGSLIAIQQSNMDDTAKAIALASVAVGGAIYREAVNTADTRTWEILPKQFFLTQFPIPEDRRISVELPGLNALQVKLPETCRSAIVYVSAPDRRNIACHVLPLTNQ